MKKNPVPATRFFLDFGRQGHIFIYLMQKPDKLFVDALGSLVRGLEKKTLKHQIYKPAGTGHATSDRNETDLHCHESWELKIPLKGVLCCRFEAKSLAIQSFIALLIAPQTVHYATVPSDLGHNTTWLNCLFESGDIRLMLMDGRRLAHYFLSADQKSELTTLLGRPANEFCEQIALVLEHAQDEAGQKMANNWLAILFAALVDAISLPPASSRVHETVSRAIAILNTMSHDVTLTVGGMAKMLNISPKYLSSVFRRLTGVSPRQKLVRIRLEHAFRQLQTGRFSVKEVAAMTGWQNQFYFSNSFRRHYGVPPSEVVPLKQNNALKARY